MTEKLTYVFSMSITTEPQFSNPRLVRGISALVAAVLCWIFLWQLNAERDEIRQLEEVQLLEAYASGLSREFDRALISVKVLSVLSEENELSKGRFQRLASELYNQLDGVLSLQLAPDAVVSYMYPDDMSSGIRGQKLLEHPVTQHSARAALESRQLLIDGPRTLNQGGKGIVIRLPVFREGLFWGFATAVFRLDELLGRIRLEELKILGFDFNIWVRSETGSLQSLFESSLHFSGKDFKRQTIAVANQEWILGIRSTNGSLISYISWLELFVAVLIVWLVSALAVATSQLYRHRNELSGLVDEKTADLRQQEVNLKQAQRVARIGSWFCEPDMTVRSLSDQAMQVLQTDEPEQRLADYALRVKPDYRALFQSFINSAVQANRSIEYQVESQGEVRWLREVVELDSANNKWVGTVQDITSEKRSQEVIWRQANIDELTELPNVNYLKTLLEAKVAQLSPSSDSLLLLLFDIQHFKAVNDSYGKRAGDELLVAVVDRLSETFPDAELMGRFSADVFMVVLRGQDEASVINDTYSAVEQQFEVPLLIEGIEEVVRYVSFNIGLAFWPKDGYSAEEILRCTEVALHAAKAQGEQGRICPYSSQLLANAKEVDELRLDLRKAVRDHDIFMMYQPLIDAASEKIIGVEALVRWQHPEKGFIGPDKFIPLAERDGLIFSLGKAIFRQVSRDSAFFAEHGLGFLRININISRTQFFDDGFSDFLVNALNKDFPADQKITLEVTESYEFLDFDALHTVISKVDKDSLQWSLDDFGTGYSSYSAIGLLPINNIKIDRSFIASIEQSEVNQAIVRNIITMAHTLNKTVTAEGIESRAQAVILKEMGCDFFQGYFFSKPLMPNVLIEWYRERY